MQGKIIIEMDGDRIGIDADVSEVNGAEGRLQIMHSLLCSLCDNPASKHELATLLVLCMDELDDASEVRGGHYEG